MAYSINQEDDIFIIAFEGDTDYEENVEARDLLASKMNQENINKVLVDMVGANLDGVSPDDLVNFGDSWVDVLVTDEAKFAVFMPSREANRKKVDISVCVGLYNGIKLKLFEEKSDALKWLEA